MSSDGATIDGPRTEPLRSLAIATAVSIETVLRQGVRGSSPSSG